jgi:hypothetical protein
MDALRKFIAAWNTSLLFGAAAVAFAAWGMWVGPAPTVIDIGQHPANVYNSGEKFGAFKDSELYKDSELNPIVL